MKSLKVLFATQQPNEHDFYTKLCITLAFVIEQRNGRADSQATKICTLLRTKGWFNRLPWEKHL